MQKLTSVITGLIVTGTFYAILTYRLTPLLALTTLAPLLLNFLITSPSAFAAKYLITFSIDLVLIRHLP